MKQFFTSFAKDECGAITVDWVVLTALVCTLLAAGYGLMESATTDTAGATSDYMTDWSF
ncbi:Flp family type IVb pilin [Aquicoccus sp.]|uniref:Flp family type IVb pilin n=1 Tax=Aquicoccus sp. TaxID=2055851 RepID=UPI00356821F5